MTVINTNVGALTSRTYAVQANNRMQTSMERLSSGLRINSAADDAAGLAVANKMESQLRGMNQAIRNSQDGISLVQTAESGMSEISNMVIRMRELAVQMNNGVYTDSDRTNAQLEITALLAEVDKIATNSAFNQVKILDGTYSKDIRAGNTNPEVINVTIDRMNTDSLGGVIVTTGTSTVATSSTIAQADTKSKVTISAVENREVSVAQAQLGSHMTTFVSNNGSGTYSLSGTGTADFTINATTGAITSNKQIDFENPTAAGTNNSYSLTVNYASATGTFDTDVTLNITDLTAAASTTGTITASVEEAASITTNTTASPIVSANFQEFAAANTGGTYSLGGSDGTISSFSIDATTGVITLGRLDDENNIDANTDGTYEITIQYVAGGQTMSEALTLDVTDASTDDGSAVNDLTLSAQAGTNTVTFDFDASATATTSVNMANLDASMKIFADENSGGTFSLGTITGTGDLTSSGISISTAGSLSIVTDAASDAGTTTFDLIYTSGSTSHTSSIVMTSATAGSTTIDVNNAASATSSITVDVDGKELTHTLNNSTIFTGLAQAESNEAGGTFSISGAGTSGVTLDNATTGQISFADNVAAGSYTVDLVYAGTGGSTFTQSATFVVTDTEQATATLDVSAGSGVSSGTLSSTEITAAKSTLTATEAREMTFSAVATGGPISAAFKTFVDAHTGGTYTLGGTDGTSSFTVDDMGVVTSRGLVDFEAKSTYDLTLTYTSGDDSYTETISIGVTNDTSDDGDHIENVDISTQAGAATAVTILDEAINQISASQAKLGAIQNRLNHNIDNLSMASMLTETARGRIVDADFARETSELSKQQILAQAATSMLAQANQSKQSVLALLQ